MNTVVRPRARSSRTTRNRPSRLLGREHRGGLVEDEQPRAAVQRAQDLDPLEVAHRQVADARLGVDPQAVALAQAAGRPRAAASRSNSAAARRLVTDGQVLGHRQRREQHEVLVDHRDAQPVGGLDVADGRPARPPTSMRPGVGPLDAREDAHERRLAGAVLAHHGVDLAGAQLEVDAVERHARRRTDATMPRMRDERRRRPAAAAVLVQRCIG